MVPYATLKSRPNGKQSQPPAKPMDIIETACESHTIWTTSRKAHGWNVYHACFTYVEAWYGIDAARKLYKRISSQLQCKPVNPMVVPIQSNKPEVPEWFDETFATDEERLAWEYIENAPQRGPEYVLSHEYREDQEMWLECGDSVDGPPLHTRGSVMADITDLRRMRKTLRDARDAWDRDEARDTLQAKLANMEFRYGTYAYALSAPDLRDEQLDGILYTLRQREYTYVDGSRVDLKPTLPRPYADPYTEFTQAWTGISTERGSGGREMQFLGQARFEDGEDGWLESTSYMALADAIQYGKTDAAYQLQRVDWTEFFRRAGAYEIVKGLQAILFAVPDLFWDAMNVLEDAVGEFNALTFGGIAESEPFACQL